MAAGYASLDLKDVRDRALNAPTLFLRESSAKPFIIDEIQKVPELFDAIKHEVDSNRRPGR